MTPPDAPDAPPVCGHPFDSMVCVATRGHEGPHVTSNAAYPHGLPKRAADAPRDLLDVVEQRIREAESDRDRFRDALEKIASYKLVGTEMTLHIDFQGWAKAALVGASRPGEPREGSK